MVPLNLTRYTFAVVFLGVVLAIAVFRPQILPPKVEALAKQTIPAEEPTPMPVSEQHKDGASVPVDQVDSVPGQEDPETEQLKLAEEWDLLRAEQAKLDQDKKDLDAEKAEVMQEWANLEIEQASLAQEKEALQVEQAELAEEWEKLEAEQATLAGTKEGLEAQQASLGSQRRSLQAREANLLEEKLRVERLRNVTVAAFSIGSLLVGVMVLLAAIAVWKEKQGRAAPTRKTPGAARGRKPIRSPKVPSPTYGGNGKGRKEVVHIS
jgi:hypothetical protein